MFSHNISAMVTDLTMLMLSIALQISLKQIDGTKSFYLKGIKFCGYKISPFLTILTEFCTRQKF